MKKTSKASMVKAVASLAVLLCTATACATPAAGTPTASPAPQSAEGGAVFATALSAGAPVELRVLPQKSCYDSEPGLPEDLDYCLGLFAEVELSNTTDQAVTVEQMVGTPNSLLYGESPSPATLLPEDTQVALHDLLLWELYYTGVKLKEIPVVGQWDFGAQQLTFPLELAPGQTVTGNVYFPGGYREPTGLPMAEYAIDMVTSVGTFTTAGMVTAPSNKRDSYGQTGEVICDATLARAVANYMNESQILLWVDSVALREASESAPTPTEKLYRAVSQMLVWLTEQGAVTPAVQAEHTLYYRAEEYETVAEELLGLQCDFSALAVEIPSETGTQTAVPLWHATEDHSYAVTSTALKDTFLIADFATPETADGPLYEAQFVQTLYAPSAVDDNVLCMEGLPHTLYFTKNKTYQYCPYRISAYYIDNN
ncbi:MAG: hypothetical protein PHO10_04065 [Gemmiger sp.]|nr:hypothetical protein [Gemmiger sp.]